MFLVMLHNLMHIELPSAMMIIHVLFEFADFPHPKIRARNCHYYDFLPRFNDSVSQR